MPLLLDFWTISFTIFGMFCDSHLLHLFSNAEWAIHIRHCLRPELVVMPGRMQHIENAVSKTPANNLSFYYYIFITDPCLSILPLPCLVLVWFFLPPSSLCFFGLLSFLCQSSSSSSAVSFILYFYFQLPAGLRPPQFSSYSRTHIVLRSCELFYSSSHVSLPLTLRTSRCAPPRCFLTWHRTHQTHHTHQWAVLLLEKNRVHNRHTYAAFLRTAK